MNHDEPKKPADEQQASRENVWTKMLARAGTHVDPNPPSAKARKNGNAHLRKPEHALNHWKF